VGKRSAAERGLGTEPQREFSAKEFVCYLRRDARRVLSSIMTVHITV